jgi:hypothetical protein
VKGGEKNMRKKLIISGAVGFFGIALAVGIALAAPGDPVPPGSITTPGPGGVNCGGIGVAYDGTNILYTCAGESAVRKTDLTGANLGSVATKDATGAPITLDAIAWDATDNKLWGGNLDGAGNCRIYETDMTTGVAAFKFSFTDPNCGFTYYDGLTVDKTTNTLWLSPDVSQTIHHFTKAGVEIAADLINFAALTPVGEPDVNSGLAIGLDGTLFAGTDGFGKIVSINSPGAAATFGGVFTTVTGRDEDLECGPVTNGKETILSRDFESPKIDILEAPKGSCQSPVQPSPTPTPTPTPTPSPSPSPILGRMTGGGTIGDTDARHGFELHCDATVTPNNLEVNWGKGNKFHLDTLTAARCSDDPSITPNPPTANFDTYVGNGLGSYNGVAGYKAKWKFTDAGEPGTSDNAIITITNGTDTFNFSGNLSKGNQQAHN